MVPMLCMRKIVVNVNNSANIGSELAQKMIEAGALELLKDAEKIAF